VADQAPVAGQALVEEGQVVGLAITLAANFVPFALTT
jgi:hypothetical protein